MLRDKGEEFGFQGSKFGDYVLGLSVLDFGFCILSFGFWFLGFRV